MDECEAPDFEEEELPDEDTFKPMDFRMFRLFRTLMRATVWFPAQNRDNSAQSWLFWPFFPICPCIAGRDMFTRTCCSGGCHFGGPAQRQAKNSWVGGTVGRVMT